jgi:hypothetical protein
MSEKRSPEKMLVGILRVAELLVKPTDLRSDNNLELKHAQNEMNKLQTLPIENTKQ